MLREVELLRVRLPLIAPFRTASNFTATKPTAVKDALLVHVVTDDAKGWGECVAQADAGYLPETIDDAHRALRDELIPRAFAGASFAGASCVTARAALADALLDARLRAEGVSLAQHLGATARFVEAGVVAGIEQDIDTLRRTFAVHAAAGYRRVKCKVVFGFAVEPLTIARQELGPDIALAADANGDFTFAEARTVFGSVDDLGLQCVEQPCGPDALDDHARLRHEIAAPVCLDEAVTGVPRVDEIADRHAADIVAIKPGRLGGVDAARAAVDRCVERGIDALAGGMLETGIGRAGLLAVAALPGITMTGDCSASERYFGPDGDLTEPFVLEDGRLRVPTRPGLGVTPRPERLAACTVERERLTR